jgi:heat shock protein HspQ
LDRDKLKYALQAQLRASVFFDETVVISSDLDPKYYNDKEIKENLA